jgi:hypothetical protein
MLASEGGKDVSVELSSSSARANFNFQQRHGKLDWRILNRLNVEEIVEMGDVDALEVRYKIGI